MGDWEARVEQEAYLKYCETSSREDGGEMELNAEFWPAGLKPIPFPGGCLRSEFIDRDELQPEQDKGHQDRTE